MPETVYTAATRIFDSLAGERLLSVDAGTGTVLVEFEHGTNNWIVLKTYTADTVELLNFGTFGRRVRLTITGNATYAI